ncbi:MAG TPA: SdrD B-like domain-containing protein, partial [Anaerolineae bacterium]|nr:SdrD B-like domain-containing protein [Anaerolineae bacterium]
FTSEIGDLVWFDINANAVQDPGEDGMAGVVLNLYDAGADGVCGTADDTWLDNRTTDSVGAYMFDLLLEGSYCVAVDLTTVAADHFLTPGMANPHGPIALAPDLDPDEQYLDADFGFYPGGSIGDYVWLDANGDAVQDASESGIAGVVVNLYEAGPDGLGGTADDIFVASATTDANGYYLFDPLPMRIYWVDVVESSLPADVFLSPGIVEPLLVNLGPGEDFLAADFGYYPGGSIGDYVWFDENRDGVQDASESGISGVVVNLYAAGADVACGTADDVMLDSATTDADGMYVFDPLPIGMYCAVVDESTVPLGLNLSEGSTNPHGPIDLGAWEDYLVADFGYACPDIVITKAVDKAYVHRYEDLTFTIVVANAGPGPADGVVVTDEISEYLEYVRLNTTQGTAEWNGGTRMVTAVIGYMDEGDEVTITITARAVNIPVVEIPKIAFDAALVDFDGDCGPVESNEVEAEIVYFYPGEVPEPSTMVLLGSGLLSLAGYARLRRRRRREE